MYREWYRETCMEGIYMDGKCELIKGWHSFLREALLFR